MPNMIEAIKHMRQIIRAGGFFTPSSLAARCERDMEAFSLAPGHWEQMVTWAEKAMRFEARRKERDCPEGIHGGES